MRLFLLFSVVSALELDELDIDTEFSMSDIQERFQRFFAPAEKFPYKMRDSSDNHIKANFVNVASSTSSSIQWNW